ncbi:MAG TPA: hypothetical protein VN894_02795 [Polyangiaceae bacterium]|nr:hypothetical protein [Polyangiaceae bacterium]
MTPEEKRAALGEAASKLINAAWAQVRRRGKTPRDAVVLVLDLADADAREIVAERPGEELEVLHVESDKGVWDIALAVAPRERAVKNLPELGSRPEASVVIVSGGGCWLGSAHTSDAN